MGKLGSNTLDWLLDSADPGVRYLALRDLVGAGEKELAVARRNAHTEGPIAQYLGHMDEQGYWVQPGAGYYPKYTGTVWSVIALAQLGASVELDGRIAAAINYLLGHSLAPAGQFTVNGAPSGTADCLQGNLCASLTALGCRDQRLDRAFEWMARSLTGEGVAPMGDRSAPLRYYAGKCGPLFACGSNNAQSCAWGAVAVMMAFGGLPGEKRTPLIERAIKTGVDFLFSKDPAAADYPSGYSARPSRSWWKFGFPVFYVKDVLQNVEALVRLGYGGDRRLKRAMELVLEKQDERGRWPLEYDYTGKTWVDFGVRKQPNKWVTLRAMRAQAAAERQGRVRLK